MQQEMTHRGNRQGNNGGNISPVSYAPTTPPPQEDMTLSLPQQTTTQPQLHEQPALVLQRPGPEDVPVPAEDAELEEIPDSVVDAILDDDPAQNAETFRQSSLGRALRDPDRPDGGPGLGRTRGATEDAVQTDRSPTALMVLAREFVCFLAKRKGKPDNHEINYRRSTEEMQKKLDESRAIRSGATG